MRGGSKGGGGLTIILSVGEGRLKSFSLSKRGGAT